MDPKIHLTIKNRESTVFEGDASSVSSYNDVGPFDILPMHENFISLIKDKLIIHSRKEQKEKKIYNGVLKVKDNKVDIYLGL